MVTYDQLAYLKLDPLDAAATSFEKLVRNWDLESDYEGQVIRPLVGSNWSGSDADAAAELLTSARKQIIDAFDEASSIARTLRDLHDQLAAAQRTLRQIVADAETQHLTVDDTGAVHWPPATSIVDRKDPEYAGRFKNLATGISDRLTVVLNQATDADSAAAAALATDTGSNPVAFNAKPIGGIAEQEAAQATQLAIKGGYMSDKELGQLDALLKAHANDPRFATAFYQKLGPKESLLFFGQLSWGSAGNGANPDPARLDLMKTLQTQMGVSLASATNLAGWPHLDQAWITGLHQAGTQQLQLDMNNPSDPLSNVYGYQILSNYLRTGSYDTRFLTPIAQDITDLSKADPTRWINQSLQRTNDRINFLDATAGFNPMTGVLQGLGNSHQAATDYFQNPNNLKYLASIDNKNIMLFTDTTGVGIDSYKAAHAAQIDALGNALQAATTGVNTDPTNGTTIPLHSKQMANVASQVMNTFGKDPELLRGDFSQLDTSVSHIAATYIADLDKSLNKNAPHILTYGTFARVDPGNAAGLIHALGQDPNSYGALLQAQNAYTALQLQHYAANTDVRDPFFASTLGNIAQDGAQVNGILAQSRVAALKAAGVAADAKFNAAIDRNVSIAKTVWSMTAAKFAGSIPLVGGYINSGVTTYINTLGASFHQNHTQQQINDSYAAYLSASQQTQDAARNAIYHALGSGAADAADTAAKGAENGFTAGVALGMSAQAPGQAQG